jgi:hypothetical protein
LVDCLEDVFGIEPRKLVEASDGMVTDLKKGTFAP